MTSHSWPPCRTRWTHMEIIQIVKVTHTHTHTAACGEIFFRQVFFSFKFILLYPLCPWDTHYQFSIKTLFSEGSKGGVDPYGNRNRNIQEQPKRLFLKVPGTRSQNIERKPIAGCCFEVIYLYVGRWFRNWNDYYYYHYYYYYVLFPSPLILLFSFFFLLEFIKCVGRLRWLCYKWGAACYVALNVRTW